MKPRYLLGLAGAMVLGWSSPVVIAQPYDLTWHTIDGGGGTSTGGAFGLSGTIGQPDAQTPPVMAGGGFELVGGFWANGFAAAPVPGDCDGDGDVDLANFNGFAGCLTSPGGGVSSGCDCFDLNGDGNVDLMDFAEMQVGFTP